MRQARLKAPGAVAVAYYHCVSRVVDRRFVLGPQEKERFIALMREYERFCGVKVLTYCVMSNHFHLLLGVPAPPARPMSDEELLGRIEGLSGCAGSGGARQTLERLRTSGEAAGAEAFRRRYFSRMWDVSAFMKLLKQRFTQWFNHRHSRKGTLWEERFRSVLVEGAGNVLAAMSAYIDLNPVRAGLVSDPAQYAWCGYAEAVRGLRVAQSGLRVVAAGKLRVAETTLNMAHVLEVYQRLLLVREPSLGTGGAATAASGAADHILRSVPDRTALLRKVAQSGRLGLEEYLRLRVRYFADGAVLGSRGFVDGVFTALRHRFGPRRRDGGRRFRGVEGRDLYALRDLRVNLMG